jgi:hypothetical protein
VPELSDEELDALVEEATVDAYGDDEQTDRLCREDSVILPIQ